MTGHPRARRSGFAALVAILALALAACDSHVPNTIFGAHSQFGHQVDDLTMGMVYAGAAVFVFVEAALIFAIFKFRYRPGNTKAVQSHGNTKLEIAWTFIPAVILAFIAVPTVRMIFLTQALAPAGALEVEVIGHQWWWEFRYPEYKIVTANELYLPVGRPVTFSLRTNDVLHSFWIPQLNGKRDLISNHTNHIWFTPDSAFAWNGFCAEYCGTSHANMRFKVFTVSPADFEAWAAHQKTNAIGSTPPAPAVAAADSAKAGGAAVMTAASAKGTTTVGNGAAPPPVVTPVM